VTDGQTVRRSDGQTDGQTESIIAKTALCIARAMLTRCKNSTNVGGSDDVQCMAGTLTKSVGYCFI